MTHQERILREFDASALTARETLGNCSNEIEVAALKMSRSLIDDGKVLVCGNGGSAAQAQHFSSTMLNRFERERPSLPAIALTCDTSALTSIANDYNYDEVFAKQIRALGRANDILLVYTTGGNSANILLAITAAHDRDMTVIALSGHDGGALVSLLADGDVEIRVPSQSSARVHETHLIITHCLCDLVDQIIFGE